MANSRDFDMLQLQYKIAIEARDKLNDTYYKWMSHYYLANAGVLVAVTSFSKEGDCLAVLLFSFFGFFICLIWHLSCKGHRYWVNNWMNLIIMYEKKLSTEKIPLKVYSVFSEDTDKNQNSFLNIISGANISTSKLTLIFTAFSTISWLFYGLYSFYNLKVMGSGITKILISAFLIIFLVIYFTIIPRVIKSKKDGHESILSPLFEAEHNTGLAHHSNSENCIDDQ